MEPHTKEWLGINDPRKMSSHYFHESRFIDYQTAIRADVSKQIYSVAPRYWYIDAVFECNECLREFTWTAEEQKAWFEQYDLWVDAEPRICKCCIAARRKLKDLRREYDALVSSARNQGSFEQKLSVISIILELQVCLSNLPKRMLDTLHLFQKQTGTTR